MIDLDLAGLAVMALSLLFPVIIVAGWLQHQRRVKALQTWAAQTGWTYVGSDDSLVERWRGQPFGVGTSRRVSELVVGRFGPYPAMSFAYRYTTGSGKDRHTYTFHVVTLTMPAWLPGLQLTPQGLGARLVSAFGGQDLEFESVDFNQRWRVEARDPRFAHDVLHPRMLERLVRPDALGLNLRLVDTEVLCWSPGLPDTDTLARRLGVMRALVDGIPRHVWLDHGDYDPSTAPRS